MFFGSPWGHSGGNFVVLGCDFGPPEVTLEALWTARGHIWSSLGPLWTPMGSLWRWLDDFGGTLGRSDLEFDMVFTDPNACRPFLKMIVQASIFLHFLTPNTSENPSPKHQKTTQNHQNGPKGHQENPKGSQGMQKERPKWPGETRGEDFGRLGPILGSKMAFWPKLKKSIFSLRAHFCLKKNVKIESCAERSKIWMGASRLVRGRYFMISISPCNLMRIGKISPGQTQSKERKVSMVKMSNEERTKLNVH